MTTFALYPHAWFTYILLGLVFLYLVDLKLRRRSIKFRMAILSLLTAGAFTPAQVGTFSTYAPIVIASLFNAEIEGASAVYFGFIEILLVAGIIFCTLLSIRYFLKLRQKKLSEPES